MALTRATLLRAYTILVAIAALITLAFGIGDVDHVLRRKAYDGYVDWVAARAWWEGKDPYSAAEMKRTGLDSVGHPPTTSFYALPLAGFELQTMSRILGNLVIALLFAQLLWMAFELRVPSPPWSAALALGVLLMTPFMKYHLGLAQISELIGFCYFAAWMLLRRGRSALAGAVLGFACTIKLFPGVMVLFLLLSRRWRGVIAAVAVWLAVAVVMTARFGWRSWLEFFSSEKLMADYWMSHLSNASIHGISLRLFYSSCEGWVATDPRATALAAAVSLALLVLCWRLSRRATARVETVDLPYALFVLLSLFTNPFFFEHYNVVLVLPIAIGGVALLRAWRAGLPSLRALSGFAAICIVFGVLSYNINRARDLLPAAMKFPDEYHWWVHYFEVACWLSTPLLMGNIGGLLFWFERRNFRGLAPLHALDP